MNNASRTAKAQELHSVLKEKLPQAISSKTDELLAFFCSTEAGIEPAEFFSDFISRHKMNQSELMPVLWMAIDQVRRRKDGLSEEATQLIREELLGKGIAGQIRIHFENSPHD